MSLVNALALLLGVIGAILTYFSLGPAVNAYFIWAVFIFTATGVALGGTPESFKNLVLCALAGMVIAWIAAMIVLNVPGAAATLGLPIWAAIVVGASTACLALIAHIKIFPAIPATVIGYAVTFAYLLQTPDRLSTANLTSASLANPLACITLSILVAAVFGLVTLNLAGKMTRATA